MVAITTNNARATQNLARMLAKELGAVHTEHALIIALQGDLGAGKTTFAQGFARALGVKERMISPTFVLMKIYQLGQTSKAQSQKPGLSKKKTLHIKLATFNYLVHIDCYRITHARDMEHLGLREILRDRDAIVVIEWPERIKKLLPKDAIVLNFTHGKHRNERIVRISQYGKSG